MVYNFHFYTFKFRKESDKERVKNFAFFCINLVNFATSSNLGLLLMKNFLGFHYFMLLYTLLICIDFQAQTSRYIPVNFTKKHLKAEFLQYLAKNYTSHAHDILSRKHFDFYTQWAKGSSHYQVLSSFAQVVHETCHAVNHGIGGFWNQGYYISPSIQINVPKSKVFKTNVIDRGIPEEWKKRIFRYNAYIRGLGDDDEVASIALGIYGLLDEYVAYYQSTKAVVELYGYYQSIAPHNNPYYLTLYLSNCQSAIYAFYEFRLFISWYLKHARLNHPEVYQSIIKNKSLKAVFSLTTTGYQHVVDLYFRKRRTIIQEINNLPGKKAEISGNFLHITQTGKSGKRKTAYGIPDAEIAFLQSLFTPMDIQMLENISFRGMNEKNFKSFLAR
jgi:hypothetical protein